MIAKRELKDGQYQLRKTMVGEAGVASVMAKLLTIYQRCLSMSKPRLEVFLIEYCLN